MSVLRQLRQQLVQQLWQYYVSHSSDMRQINAAFNEKGIHHYPLDHFAILDLPGTESGRFHLRQLFSMLGYHERGSDYLPDKQNDFLWMAESGAEKRSAHDTLPQAVLADFRLEAMPPNIRHIIQHYAQQAGPAPVHDVSQLIQSAHQGNLASLEQCSKTLFSYLTTRDWPLPTTKEFYTVQEFNELLAWVLVCGRRPNHFTLSIHLLDHFTSLTDFHQFIEQEAQLKLNQEGGTIKGGKNTGIAQGSTLGTAQPVTLADGTINLPAGFMEFIWRYPTRTNHGARPVLWRNYFTGFIARHADRVIESLYQP